MMKPIKRLGLFVTLMAGVSSPAMAQGNQNPGAGGRYFNADGSRTDNLNAAAATWASLPTFSPMPTVSILNNNNVLVDSIAEADSAKRRMNVHYAFARRIFGQGQIVGVLDEGIDPNHGDFSEEGKVRYIDVTERVLAAADETDRLAGRIAEGTLWREGEQRFDGRPLYRIGGTLDHGVHVAGIIAASGTSEQSVGVAPDAVILSGTNNFRSDILLQERKIMRMNDADPFGITLRQMVAEGARVINNSWGGSLGGLRGNASLDDALREVRRHDGELGRLLGAARGNDVVMVFAAGNGQGAHADRQASAPLLERKLESQWLSVVNLNREGGLAGTSNMCGQTRAWCIAAPGTQIYSAGMKNNMTPATAQLARRTVAFDNEGQFFEAVDNFREGLTFLRDQRGGAFRRPPVARSLDELHAQNPDARVLGQAWARSLYDLALRYQNAREINAGRDEGDNRGMDDMDIFMSARNRFASYDEHVRDGPRHQSRIRMLVGWARRYPAWSDSPLYHMEIEYMRLVEAATTREYVHEFKSGTSMAAPHVSGALALVMERFPYATADLARDTLLTTATDIGNRGVDATYGWGLADVGKAMKGPGALLGQTIVNLPAGMEDVWENDIFDGSSFLGGEYRGGLTLTGGGLLALNANIAYLDNTNVVGGTLLVNGKLWNSHAFVGDEVLIDRGLESDQGRVIGGRGVIVERRMDSARGDIVDRRVHGTGGVIGGRGTLLSLTVRSGGAVSPGNPILDGEDGRFGKLTITNDLIFERGSRYLVDSRVNAEEKLTLNPGGDPILLGADLIDVKGHAQLNGGIVEVQADQGDWKYHSSADILIAQGGVQGRFDGVTSNLGFLTPILDTGKNKVTLKLERNDVTFASVGRTPNQVASGAGLDGVPAPRPRGDAPSNRRANAVPAAPRNSSGAPNARVAESPANNRVAASGATNPRAPLSTTAQVAPHAEIAGGSSRASSATASNFSSGGSATFAPETLAAVPAKEVAAASEATPRATPIAALEQGQLYGALVDSSVDTVSASLDSFSGETHASLAAVAANDTVFVRDAMLRRMPHSTMALAAGSGRDGGNPVASGYVAWGQAIAGVTDRDASFGIGRVKTTSKGFVTGIDKSWDNRVNIGAAFSMLDTDANVFRPGSNNNSVASRHIGAYAGAEVGVARVRAGGSWGWYNIRSGRSASVNAFGDSLSAKYKGHALQAFGEVGLGFETGSLSLEPFVNVTHVNFLGKDIAEKGGAASLSGRSKQKVTMSTIGVRSAVKIADGADGRSGFAKLNIGWRHNLDNAESGATANLSFAGAPKSFTVIGAAPGKDLAIVDLALDTPVTENLDIGVSYGGQFSDKFTAQALKATLQLRF